MCLNCKWVEFYYVCVSSDCLPLLHIHTFSRYSIEERNILNNSLAAYVGQRSVKNKSEMRDNRNYLLFIDTVRRRIRSTCRNGRGQKKFKSIKIALRLSKIAFWWLIACVVARYPSLWLPQWVCFLCRRPTCTLYCTVCTYQQWINVIGFVRAHTHVRTHKWKCNFF